MCYFAGEVENVLRELENVLHELRPAVEKAGYCQCIKYDCGCCAHFSVKEVKLVNATGLSHYDAYTSHISWESLMLYGA